jgi:hypothetical protein
MGIRDLIGMFEIQGAYQIATYDNKTYKRIILAEGYELSFSKINDEYLDAEITYMYSEDNTLVIEINIEE